MEFCIQLEDLFSWQIILLAPWLYHLMSENIIRVRINIYTWHLSLILLTTFGCIICSLWACILVQAFYHIESLLAGIKSIQWKSKRSNSIVFGIILRLEMFSLPGGTVWSQHKFFRIRKVLWCHSKFFFKSIYELLHLDISLFTGFC